MKTFIAALGIAFASGVNANPCHHYSTWNYPYPQPACGRAALAARNDSNWYVEIKPETPVDEQSSSTVVDQRTQDQIKEFVEHNKAMALHHDELDDELNLLLQQERTISELKGK